MGIKKGRIEGILTAKIEGKGTLSEGPSYWIKPTDEYSKKWDEILIRKQTMRWMDDPKLHPLIDKKVWVEGEIIETKSTITMEYEDAGALDA